MKSPLSLILIALMFNSHSYHSDDPPTYVQREVASRASASHVDLSGWAQSDPARRSARSVSSRRVRMVRAYVPTCEGNLPGSPDSLGTLCPQATELCAGTPDPLDLAFWVYTAPAGANTQQAAN